MNIEQKHALAVNSSTSPAKLAESNAHFETGKDATRLLAQYALNTRYEDLPESIQKEASRAFVNFVGVTVGSCQHEAVNIKPVF